MKRGILATTVALGLLTMSLPVQAASPSARASTFITTANFPQPAQWDGNPFGGSGIGDTWTYVYDSLFQYVRETDKIYPELGLSMMDKGNDTIVKLRKGVRWSDGKPFTSKDVWGYFMLNNGDGLTRWLTGLDTPDPYTVVFHWKAPAPFPGLRHALIAQDGLIGLLPYHLFGKWEDQAAALLKQAKPAKKNQPAGPFGLYITPQLQQKLTEVWQSYQKFYLPEPIGTGPYVVLNHTSSEVRLQKNPYYWGKKTVHFPFVNLVAVSGDTQAYAMLRSGNLDYYNAGAPSQDVLNTLLNSNKNIVFYHWSDVASVGLMFNQAHPYFNDKRFRQAIIYALNRNQIRQVVQFYGTVPTTSLTGVAAVDLNKWTTPSIRQQMTDYSYAPQRAATLLRQLGWKKNASGQWEDPKGKVPNFTIGVFNGNPEHVQAAQIAADLLTQFGLPTHVVAQDGSVYWNNASNGDGGKGQFDMSVDWADVAWGMTYPWQSLQATYEGGLANMMHLPQTTVNGQKQLNLTLPGPDGKKVDIKQAVDSLEFVTDSAQRKKIISTLAWITNQNAFGVQLLTNAAGAWVSTQYVTGWPLESEFAKFNRVIDGNRYQSDPTTYEKINELNFGYAQQMELRLGTIRPRQ
ncbi:MAG: ABC transporter substrate-binding protein [Alicyclobacillus sp.]|nr:ABC transporter substrate-binding protein [Alicyclobacillus sp.]